MKVAQALSFASQGLTKAEAKVVERIAFEGGLSAARLAQLTAELREHADPDPVSVRNTLAPRAPES